MNLQHISTTSFHDTLEQFSRQGKTPLFFAENHRIIGILAVADIIKETSKASIQELKAMHIHVAMLTGDTASGSKLRLFSEMRSLQMSLNSLDAALPIS